MAVRHRSHSMSSEVSIGTRRRISTSSGMVMKRFESAGVGYGSLGGYDFFSTSYPLDYEAPMYGNWKLTMQNLNDRLASYVEKVHFLEKANSKLELQIKTFYENKSPMQSKDMSSYFKTISDLRAQILSSFVKNAEVRLKLDNTRFAAEDFQIKYETEKNFRMIAESDLTRLREVLGNIKLSIADLDNHHSGLKEELLYLKKSHEEDLHMMRARHSGSVNVEIDSTAHSDLGRMLDELRIQYEAIVEKNQKEVEQWYQRKVETLHTQVSSSHTEINTSQTEISDRKRTVQSLEIELQGILTLKQQLEQSVVEIRNRYSERLSQLQTKIDYMQDNKQRLTDNIQEQATDYDVLLDIRMRLEMEIAEYRRLLGGEEHMTVISTSKSALITKETVTEITEEEEIDVHNPHRQRRVTVIVDDMVDGKVVCCKVDEKIQELN